MDDPSNPKHPEADPPTATDLPETDASRAIRRLSGEIVGSLQQYFTQLAALAVRLTPDERQSGTGKLLDGEAVQLARVAQVAAARPEFVVGLAAKDGGIDPSTFETDALLDHLAVHVAARDAARAITAEAANLAKLMGDVAIHRGAQARTPLLAAYKVLSAVAAHDPVVANAIRGVQEFFERPNRGKPESGE